MSVVCACVQWAAINGRAVRVMGVMCVGLFSGLCASGGALCAL